jgi:ATP-dependent DNA ligase
MTECASCPARSPLDQRYHPQIATLVKNAPTGDEWLHDLKLDGYHIGAAIEGGAIALVSRRENNRAGVGSLLLGVYDGPRLVFAGGVGTYWTREEVNARCVRHSRRLETPRCRSILRRRRTSPRSAARMGSSCRSSSRTDVFGVHAGRALQGSILSRLRQVKRALDARRDLT